MVATYNKKAMLNMLRVTGIYTRDIIDAFFVCFALEFESYECVLFLIEHKNRLLFF